MVYWLKMHWKIFFLSDDRLRLGLDLHLGEILIIIHSIWLAKNYLNCINMWKVLDIWTPSKQIAGFIYLDTLHFLLCCCCINKCNVSICYSGVFKVNCCTRVTLAVQLSSRRSQYMMLNMKKSMGNAFKKNLSILKKNILR